MENHLVRATHTLKLVGIVTLSTIFTSTSGLAQELIIDNENTQSNFEAVAGGDWYTSSGPNPYLGNSLYSVGSAWFQWSFLSLQHPGDYDVYAWWTYHANRSNNVPYYLDLGSSEAQVFVNQNDPDLGGQWNLLGRFSFDTRFGSPSIRVTSENGQANADAVMLVRVVEPAVWPVVSCPCDEYYSRAVDKYVAWGGSLKPPGYEGGADSTVCDEFFTTLSPDARYTTYVNGGTSPADFVSLQLSAHFDNRSNFGSCETSVRTNFLPQVDLYSEDVLFLSSEQFEACAASVGNFCASDPPPP